MCVCVCVNVSVNEWVLASGVSVSSLVPLIDQRMAVTRGPELNGHGPSPLGPSRCHQSCPTRCLTPGVGMGEWLCQPTEEKKDPLLLSLSASVGEWDTEQDNKVKDSSHSFPFSCTAASGEISVSPSFGTQPDISLPPHLHPPTFYLHSKVALYLPFIKGVQMWPPCNLMPLFSSVLTDWEGRKNRAVGLAEDL